MFICSSLAGTTLLPGFTGVTDRYVMGEGVEKVNKFKEQYDKWDIKETLLEL